MEGFSVAISDGWDRLTEKFINNPINQWQLRLERVVEQGGGHIENLI